MPSATGDRPNLHLPSVVGAPNRNGRFGERNGLPPCGSCIRYGHSKFDLFGPARSPCRGRSFSGHCGEPAGHARRQAEVQAAFALFS